MPFSWVQRETLQQAYLQGKSTLSFTVPGTLSHQSTPELTVTVPVLTFSKIDAWRNLILFM